MANRYYVGGTGNWSDYTSHWSASSGGAPGASLPTAADNVYFDANSFTADDQVVTVDVDAECLGMDWTGATNSPTLAHGAWSRDLSVYGSITFIVAMSCTIIGSIYIKGACDLKTNGLVIGSGATICLDQTASALTMKDDLTALGSVYQDAGTFDTGNYNLTASSFVSRNNVARTLTLGSSIVTLSGSWNLASYPNMLTITANTAEFIMTGNSVAFSGGGKTYSKVDIRGTPVTVSGNNTFGELILTAGKTVNFADGSTQTITTLSGEGTPTARIALLCVSSGTYTLNIASGTVNKYYYSIKDCIATGGATFNAYNTLDMTGNTGWNFYDIEPAVTYPTSETVIVNNNVTFTWSVTPGVQTHYDLDYSTNGIVWTNYANKVESAVASCVITAGTLSSRIYYWRVRVYFYAGTYESEYSQTSFIAVTNPVTSAVTCDLKPQPTIGWTASEQQAFQLKVGDYDTGTIYSALGTYTVPNYFDDGTYGITVRTQNSLGIWSAWTALAYFAIANVPGDAITLTAEQSGDAINLIWTTTGTYAKYYVYRDDIPIADVTDTAYADNFAFGTSTYKVRGIMADDYYTLSAEVTQALVLTYDMVSDADTIVWLPLEHSLGGPVSRAYSKSEDVTHLRFAGREYPVSAHSGFKNRRGNFNYAFKTRAEIEALMDLSGKVVVHKDTKGNRTIGIINDFAPVYTGKFYYSVSFNITQTDYNEAVTYD